MHRLSFYVYLKEHEGERNCSYMLYKEFHGSCITTHVGITYFEIGFVCFWWRRTRACLKYTEISRCVSNFVKGKAVPLQAWSGPEGSRNLRFPDFVTVAQDGGRLSALRPRKYSWYSFPPISYSHQSRAVLSVSHCVSSFALSPVSYCLRFRTVSNFVLCLQFRTASPSFHCFSNFLLCLQIFTPTYQPATSHVNPLKPNDDYSGRTAPLTSKSCILYFVQQI